MIQYIWPIAVIVLANTFYHICAKSTPSDVQPFASLTITYLVAAALSALLFFVTSENKNIVGEMQRLNWTSFIFGVAVVALEFGYLYVYRAGWKIGIGSLVANIALACVLLFVGALLYKEGITLKQVAGIALCMVGMVLINK